MVSKLYDFSSVEYKMLVFPHFGQKNLLNDAQKNLKFGVGKIF